MDLSTRVICGRRTAAMAALALLSGGTLYVACAAPDTAGGSGGEKKWTVHDESRPNPPVVQPGTPSTPEQAGTAPSDALVLFDGKDLSHWQAEGGGEATWKVASGYMEAAGGKGVATKEGFGDCQLHIEWATPEKVEGAGQGRGNSGVFLMSHYEVQVLDSYQNETYADGQAAALYGQHPPLVNASLPPGKWQTYDIIFRRPHFGADGKVTKPATVTLLHNGVLAQDHAEIKGKSAHKTEAKYERHDDKLPIRLQFHGNPTRFRNIWIRQLEGK